MWGFRQSIFERVPLKLTRLLKSNSADMLWCAHTAPAATHSPAAISAHIREFIWHAPCYDYTSRGPKPFLKRENTRFGLESYGHLSFDLFPSHPAGLPASTGECASLCTVYNWILWV